ncbi:zinc finger protein 761-like isoform X1 [Vanessa tameamea]|uniref:Zinc finger protein 761-like isoform X1 n=1 Tax=Vanessa tameamea TaxID=334116 RepID=A0A8B8HEZ7_VANTA
MAEKKSNEDDGSVIQSEDQETDMMNMFASVWVKVEVEEENDFSNSEDKKPSVRSKTRRKGKKRKFTKVLNCDECDYTTVYKNCLDLHVAGHKDSKPFSCQLCEYTTKYPTSLQRHVMIKHPSDDASVSEKDKKPLPMHKCDECEYSSYFKWNLTAHKRKHKQEKQFKCPHCTYATAYRHNFVKHCKVHNECVFYKCDKCPFVTKFEGHITRHLAKIHNEVTEKANKCEYCDFSTMVRWRLNIHQQRSKQEAPMKCEYCEFETAYMCEIKQHKVSHYNRIYGSGVIQNKMPEDIQLPPMDIQEKSDYITQETLDKRDTQNQYTLDPNCLDWNSIQVLESEDKERPFLCHMCSYTSKFKAAVQRHFQRHHTGSQNRPYKCVNCDFSTKTKDQIALHNKRSQSDKVLFCTICSFTTTYKCQHVMHQKCHYAFKCTLCHYSCRHKYELQKHFTTLHLGNGLKCSFCDYKAARKESLLCHETIHTGNKPFKCTYCSYMSVRKSLLDNHVKRYHSDIKKDVTIVSEKKIQSLKVPMPSLIDSLRGHCDQIPISE